MQHHPQVRRSRTFSRPDPPLSPRNWICCRKARENLRSKMSPFQVSFLSCPPSIGLPTFPTSEYTKSNPYPMCDICFEPFQATHTPVRAALTANSSAKLPFGLRLPCPEQHPFCISCLAEYIKGKLDPSGTGDLNTNTLVFPIRCPGCPITLWEIGIQDDLAERVLDADSMSVWVHPPFKRMPF